MATNPGLSHAAHGIHLCSSVTPTTDLDLMWMPDPWTGPAEDRSSTQSNSLPQTPVPANYYLMQGQQHGLLVPHADLALCTAASYEGPYTASLPLAVPDAALLAMATPTPLIPTAADPVAHTHGHVPMYNLVLGPEDRRLQVCRAVNEQRIRPATPPAACKPGSMASIRQLQNDEYDASSMNRELNEQYVQLRDEVLGLRRALVGHRACQCRVIQRYILAKTNSIHLSHWITWSASLETDEDADLQEAPPPSELLASSVVRKATMSSTQLVSVREASFGV